MEAGTIISITLRGPASSEGIQKGIGRAQASLGVEIIGITHPDRVSSEVRRIFQPRKEKILTTTAFGGGGRSSSYYRRSPRGGFLKRAYSKLRRLLRDLIYYMKRNPMKVFMLVIMPLITGGALTGLLHKFGIRLPHGIEKLMGGARGGGGIGHDRHGNMQFERTHMEGTGPLGAMGGAMESMGGVSNVVGAMGGIGSAMKVAKMFM